MKEIKTITSLRKTLLDDYGIEIKDFKRGDKRYIGNLLFQFDNKYKDYFRLKKAEENTKYSFDGLFINKNCIEIKVSSYNEVFEYLTDPVEDMKELTCELIKANKKISEIIEDMNRIERLKEKLKEN